MKILIFGANGMAGHIIALYFKEQGYDVTGFTRRPISYCKNILGDAANPADVKAAIESDDFDIVINAIGILNQFAEENKSMAVMLNGYLPHFIADTLKDKKARLIHISTDCVFAGNTGPYYEDSFPDGKIFYDRSKAIGEINDDKNLTFRNSIVGPDPNEKGIGLFNWFMKQNGSVGGYTGAIWTGVTTLTLAKAMESAIKENLTGLYNLVNNESINKFDLLGLFNKYFRHGEITINPNDKLQLDKSLRHKRTDFSFQVPSYDQQVNLTLASSEKLDLMYEYCGNVTSAISSGQIVPITDYLDSYGSDMKSQISDSDWKCVTFNGDIYGVPANKEKATGWGFAMNKEMADATGIDYSSIKTEEELEPLLEKVKEMYPDVYPIVSNNGSMSLMTDQDDLGGDIGSLESASGDNTTVINYYGTDEYMNEMKLRYDWAQKGLLMPDASTSTENANSLIGAGKGFGRFTNTKPGIEKEMEKEVGKEVVVLEMVKPYTTTTVSYTHLTLPTT